MTYSEYLQSDHWKGLRVKSLFLSENRCEGCFSVERLQVHHINYRNLLDCTTDDLIVLCDQCHQDLHAYLDRCHEKPTNRNWTKRCLRAYWSKVGLIHQGKKSQSTEKQRAHQLRLTYHQGIKRAITALRTGQPTVAMLDKAIDILLRLKKEVQK